MLNPNKDRLDYGQILAPPAGYELDFAVGTTYSLDLDALVGASLAMGLSEETDSSLMNNPVCLLEALRSTGDKVALFCEGGQIHMPNKVTSLYILLEKMVFSVQPKKQQRIAAYPSFHPKFWLIRYVNNTKEVVYRVIVLSRNLTFDRSWDVTYYMDGHVGENQSDKNDPLCDFLSYLRIQLPGSENGKSKSKLIRTMIKELPCVVFETSDKEFYDYQFIPNGIKRSGGGYYRFEETQLFTDTFHEIMIMSPFLSGSVIKDFNDRNAQSPIEGSRYMLITRETSLSKLKPEDVSNFSIYTLRDTVIDGETAISDESGNMQKQDIHAKMYMFLKNSTAKLYLGSLNASHNAVYGNVEFMLCLTSKRRYLNLDKLKESLFGSNADGSDNPFQEVALSSAIISEETDEANNLDAVIKEINRSGATAVAEAEDDSYTITLTFEDCDTKGYHVTVRPLLSNRKENYHSIITFQGLSITQLSEFYAVAVSDSEKTVERVLIIPTKGLPQEREKAVVTSVVSDKDCFYRYIAFLLGDNSILTILETEAIGEKGQGTSVQRTYHIPALYEKMLKTAAIAPEKFKGIEFLMRTISRDGIIPDEFETLYKTFKKAVKL